MKFTSLLTVILLFLLPGYFSLSQIQSTTFISGKCTGANSMDPTSTVSSSAPVVTAGRVLIVSPFYSTYRTFVEFNLSGVVPENAIITRATLKLYPNSRVGNPVIHTARITAPWQENSVSWTNQPSYTNTQQVTSSLLDFQGWLNIDVKNHVQNMIAGVYPNNGWMLYHNNETENANKHYIFRSDDYADPAYHPRLEISFYIPMSVTDAVINHESSPGASDGSISPVLADGPGGTYTYQWYNKNGMMPGKTALNLTGVSYGWYGLRVTSSIAGTEPFYYAFLIGENCAEKEIEFNPGPDFIDDAMLQDRINYTDVNYGNYQMMEAYEREGYGNEYDGRSSLLRFRLWIDSELNLNKGQLQLRSSTQLSPTYSNNNARLHYVISDWSENIVTYSSIPDYSMSPLALNMPAITVSNSDFFFDLLGPLENIQEDNSHNYGWLFRLTTYDNITKYQRYYSSDATNLSQRPKINFRVSTYNAHCLSYSEMKRALDGGYSYAMDGKLKFTMDEPYELDASKYLPFTIYDKHHMVLESSDIDGVVLNGSVAPLPLNFDDNRWILDISSIPGIATGEYYILEVSNSKGDKRYLRFFYKN